MGLEAFASSRPAFGTAISFLLANAAYASTLPDAQSVRINDVQGNGEISPFLGASVTIQGVVIADLQEPGELDGFFVQQESSDEDVNPATSEGIFVYCGSGPRDCPDVQLGSIVTVTGAVAEFRGQTQLDNGSLDLTVTVDDSGNNLDLVTPATIHFPLRKVTDLEAFEGMWVQIASDMYAIDYFNFDRFSEIRLWTDGSGADRPFHPTQTSRPESVDLDAVAQRFAAQSVVLDDGSSRQNIGKLFPGKTDDEPIFDLVSFNAGTPPAGFRGGDRFSGIEGVLGYSAGEYRLHVADLSAGTAIDGGSFDIRVLNLNARPAQPEDVGGSLKVASFNVFNYFTTIDDGINDVCGASQTLRCRGADSPSELSRQQAKLISALANLDADIIGLNEIENTSGVAVAQSIVDALNAATSRNYVAVATGVIGTDAIKVGLIYDAATVDAMGDFAILDTPEFVRPLTDDPKNRPALAQTFREKATSGVFTVAVNHFKSKGSRCGQGDDDPIQQSCNKTREAAAVVLANWLATDPTGSNDPDVMIIGDLNSYAMEDPIMALRDQGYTNLAQKFVGMMAYSYVFDGRWGTLDYAMANESLTAQVAGAAAWHINADEPDALDYDETFNPSAWYQSDGFRSSDHDPIVVGLNLVDDKRSAFMNQAQCIRFLNTGKSI